MKIGRWEFGIIVGKGGWGYDVGSCGCDCFEFGRFYITLLSDECNRPLDDNDKAS